MVMEIIFSRIIFFCNALLSSEWDDSNADSFFDSRLCQCQPLHAAAATEVIHCFWFFDLANSPRSKCILTSENWMLRGFRDPNVERAARLVSMFRSSAYQTGHILLLEFESTHTYIVYIYICMYIYIYLFIYLFIIHTHLVHVCPFKSHFICGILWHYSWPCDDLFVKVLS